MGTVKNNTREAISPMGLLKFVYKYSKNGVPTVPTVPRL